MASNLTKQRGFSAVEVLVVIVIVAVIIAAGWWVYQRANQEDDVVEETTTQQLEAAPQVEDEAGLAQSEEYLNELDVDTRLDTSEFDEALGY